MTYGRRLHFYQIWSLLCKYINTYYITGPFRPHKENSNMFIQNNPVLFLLHLDAKTAGETCFLAGQISLLISWHFVCLKLIVYAKSRALCCMRAVTWTRKKNSSPRWNHVKISRKLIHKTAHQVWSEFTSPSTPRIRLTQRSNDRVTTPDWWAFFFCIVKFWELSVGIWFPYQTGLTMTGKGSNSRIIRHVSERFRGQKKTLNGPFSYATRCKWWWSGYLKFST